MFARSSVSRLFDWLSAHLDRRSRRALRLSALLAILMTAAVVLHRLHVSVNVTDSMPIGIYRSLATSSSIERGAIVQVCLPPKIAAIGLADGYLIAGSCPSATAPVLKIVAAVAADRVELRDAGVLVNGRALPGSARFSVDGHGRRITPYRRGVYRLEREQLWLWTPNPRSWDSRYYGPISERDVLGRAQLVLPLWQWRFGAAGAYSRAR